MSHEESRALGERDLDDLFALGDDRRFALEGAERTVSVTLEGYPFGQVYSPGDAAFGCLEPMTAPANALVTGDCRLVDPGDEFTASFSIIVAGEPT